MKRNIYAGTYTSSTSEGIYHLQLEEGKLSNAEVFAKVDNPKYIAMQDGILATLATFEQGAGVATYDLSGNQLDRIAFEERTSCHIAMDEDRIFTANYHTGVVSVLENRKGKLKLIRSVEIQNGAGCHQIIVWKDCILVPCLFLDRVMIFDRDLNRKGSIRFNTGTGPRHGLITKDGEYFYLTSELSNELYVIHTGDWEILSCTPVLPNEETHVRSTAAIRLSEDEKYVYISTRGKDVISVLEMKDHRPELIQCFSTLGKHPRDFMLCDGYLLCANRYSNEVISFEINEDGSVGRPVSRISVPEAVSLITKS